MIALLAAIAIAAPAQAADCPCTIFSPGAVPAGEIGLNDGQPLEVGVKFRADEDGYVTALRFYKVAGNTGSHCGPPLERRRRAASSRSPACCGSTTAAV